MNSNDFRNLIQCAIKEHLGSNEKTVTRTQLKNIIKETIRIIINEMRGPEAFHRDAQDYESEAAQIRHDLDAIKKAGLEREHEALMNGIFDLPIQEFDKRVNAIAQLTKKAYRMLGRPLAEMTTTGNVAGYNIPGWLSNRGGSKSGVAGSQKLGYELTPIGKQDMERRADSR